MPRRSSVVIDGKSGRVVADVPKKTRKRKHANPMRGHMPATVAVPISRTAADDIAMALGITEAIFSTADRIAGTLRRRR